MKGAPNIVVREDGAPQSATILPFRLRALRDADANAGQTAPKIELVPATNGKIKPGKKSSKGTLGKAERPTLLFPAYRDWLKQAIIGSVILHVVAFAFFQDRFFNDVERAANSGGVTATEGVVIEIDIVAQEDSKLTPSKAPINMTVPDAKTNSPQRPQEEQKEHQKEMQQAQPAPAPNVSPDLALPQEEQAPPQKAETAPTPQSPNQQQIEEARRFEILRIQKQKAAEQKKKQEKAAPSAAAAPSKAAATPKNQGQTGANTSSYNAQVSAHLRRFQVSPDSSRGGTTVVLFTLAANGAVTSVSLGSSSGSAVLDQAALGMVRRASPFPPIPRDFTGSHTFVQRLDFRVR